MKNLLFFGAVAIMALGFSSCGEDDPVVENVSNLVLTQSVDGNVATFTATATNASSYSWDFDNGDTGSGASVTATYNFPGDYFVKCTAAGKVDQLTDSVKVTLEVGNPDIVNDVTEALCAHPWKWAGNGTLPNDFGYWSCGPKGYVYTNDTSANDWMNPFDDSWWKLGEYDGVVQESQLDDRYTFTLDKTMKYTNEYDTSGFMYNWAWQNKEGYGTPDIWEDGPVMDLPTEGSWSIEIKDHPAGTLPKTIVNGSEVSTSYIVTLNGGTLLGVGAASSIYQICRIDADTMWIRYDNTYPQDLTIKPEWADDGIGLGEGEWGYFYLVKAID